MLVYVGLQKNSLISILAFKYLLHSVHIVHVHILHVWLALLFQSNKSFNSIGSSEKERRITTQDTKSLKILFFPYWLLVELKIIARYSSDS